MLELLDTGRMACKFGKWRGGVTLVFAAACYLFSYLIFNFGQIVQTVGVTHQIDDQKPAFLGIVIALAVLGFVVQLIGSWQLFRDHVYGDYHFAKDHYKNHGW